MLETVDVSSLYTNIPPQEGIDCVKEALNERENKSIPTNFLICLLEIMLEYNIFEFNGDLYKQGIGTAMGANPARSFANIFTTSLVTGSEFIIPENRAYHVIMISSCKLSDASDF